MAEQLRQSRLFPGKMPSTSNHQCIDWMAEAWSDRNLHLQARKGYKLIGATNALDGSEDHLIAREARLFWDKLNISAKRDATIRDVECEVESGRLTWGFDAVYSLIAPFPSRQVLDEMVEFQDDEAVAPADGENVWLDDDKSDSDSAEEDDDADATGDLHDCGELAEATSAIAEPHLHEAALSADQADVLCQQSSRILALQDSIASMEAAGLMSAAETLRRCLHEEQRANAKSDDISVVKAMKDRMDVEEQALAAQR